MHVDQLGDVIPILAHFVAQKSVLFRYQVSVLLKHLLIGGAKRPVFGVINVHRGDSQVLYVRTVFE
ncbi:hypothetical protein ALP29_201368 [Pseudomonas syringae pv. avii]|uniref:Uncharacterized protein n=1 Tax=Pseudomonas syringae pv. avii TaxID=663959 RepID=A0A3M5U823_PSESX|nr:hypothetical protein ALP29_201368 [Pseudomonas syringae pv. avii]